MSFETGTTLHSRLSTPRVVEQSDTARDQAETRSAGLVDGFGRKVDHLRLSVTPACDLHCVYCRPVGPQERQDGALDDGQRLEFVQFLHKTYGLTQVRITGGEPLVYPGVVRLVGLIRDSLPDLSIAMTTNGRLLSRYAGELRSAGLDRLNVSLDSLDKRTYREITGGELSEVVRGLDAARDAGFNAPKINTVVLRSMNERELSDLTAWAFARGSEIRFLEAMPIGPAAESNRRSFVSADDILAHLSHDFELEPLAESSGATARRYQANGRGVTGVLGLIAPITQPFCASCRRIRLTADGRFFPCLLDTRHVDLTGAWSSGAFRPDTARTLVKEAVEAKQETGPQRQAATMVSLGG